MFKKITLAALLFAGLTTFTACEKDDNTPSNIVNLTTKLDGKQEVPANAATGTGTFTGSYNKDTKVLTYEVTYQGMTATPTMGHIHLGAAGTNGNAVVPFTITPSPIKGTATLSESTEAALLAGGTYANLHSSQYTGGELRGQITVK
ncbi:MULTISPECIES: CHRD domain-containing protein [Hymenobacter]|uniref:CHRD domain-containing protein n=1 Tax=Hymenobacter TaxID=89966 RepID=UPI0010586413|nr:MULTISPECIES: CHRD domain-containing protein [Hymenobacter]QIL76316.1 CHRD domain-containing protein [Hymenobacter sp. HDW8]